MSNPNDQAFPRSGFESDTSFFSPVNGLTKRELFAAMAMQTMATRNRGEYHAGDIQRGVHLDHPRWVAQAAVDYADALLAELEKEKP